jgi:hypothetical protein
MQPHTLNDLVYVALLIGLWWVKLTFSLWRRTRYLQGLLFREQQKRIDELNAMQKQLLEHFLREPVPSLSELVDRTEEEWSLRSSPMRSGKPPTGGSS